MRPIELLAPAGGLEAGLAALHFGADAVYLGLKRFSARADADNFTLDQLDAFLGHAHGLLARRRVYVAVNTLVLDRELNDLVATLGDLADLGVDAVIVQDLGVFHLARRHFPELRLHASTQMAVHSRAGAEALRDLGFARVTLAREMTLEEIRDAARVERLEVETFAHGALCYAYSGLCLFSSHMVGRSGNRGTCAYPCRDEWRAPDAPLETRAGQQLPRDPRRGFAFSMKDLALCDGVLAARDAGVASLKIEGRKKSPLWVAAAVDTYRHLLDGRLDPKERATREEDLRSIFSRPWTPLYFHSREAKDVADPDVVGHRGQRIGTLDAVLRPGRGRARLRFTTARQLSVHDGVQVEVAERGRPFGMPVDDLWLVDGERRSRAHEAPAGATVEVELPQGYPRLEVGAVVSCSSSQEAKARYRFAPPNLARTRGRRALDARVTLDRTQIVVEGSAGGQVARAAIAGPFDMARDRDKTEAGVRAAFEKLGDTRFALGRLDVEDREGIFAPASKLNELRRNLCERLEEARRAASATRVAAALAELEAPDETAATDGPVRWSLKVDRVRHLAAFGSADWEGVAELVIDVAHDPAAELLATAARLEATLGRGRLRFALPTIARDWESRALSEKVAKLAGAGHARWEVANPSGFALLGAPREGLDLSADWPLYAVNRAAARQLRAMGVSRFTLSPEDGLDNMRMLLGRYGRRATVVVFQDTPLFVSETCAWATLAGGCPGVGDCRFEEMAMRSGHGSEVLAINDRCRTVVVGRRPFCLAGRLPELVEAGAREVRADFIWRPYEPSRVAHLWRSLRSERDLSDGHAGNFDRGLA